MTTADLPTGAERRLTRAREGRVIAGVCQGAATYFDIDPVIFRIVLAVLTVFGGAGVVLYALCWIFIPEEGAPESRLERWMRGGRDDVRRIFVLALLAICVVILLSNTNIFAHRVGAAAVAVIGALLITDVVGRRRGHGIFSTRRAETPVRYGPAEAPSAPVAAPTMPMPVPSREPAWLGWFTFGAMLVVAGVMTLLASSGAANPQPADGFAICVAIAGVGLVAGGFAGRARAMIPVGVLLVFGLAVTNALPRDLTWSAGTRNWTPVASDIASSYVLGAGKADLDLTNLGTSTATIDARIGAGRLIVFVPPGAGLVIDAKMGAGRILILGHEQNGSGVENKQTVPASRPHAGTLTLHLHGGFGDLEVRDEAA
ncbi:MAG TPA: PspC domain-containing protein [Mycobacteriales bacterium]|jgi:phage shock protein PspC (stress-responsive transcriptional regulator)|nr:PspC domain-containing protein [Mycobacteriales bacterium]